MKNKIKNISVLFAVSLLLSSIAFARTYKEEYISTDKIEYTLEEDDKVSALLIIDEDGLYGMTVTELSSSPSSEEKIGITILDGNDEIYRFETDLPSLLDTRPLSEINTFIVGLTAGEYDLIIENLTRFDSVSFKIETSFTEIEEIETAGNSSFDNATEMEFRTKYFGGVSMFRETDFYTFTMPYDGYAFIEMYTPSLKYFRLYNGVGVEIGSIGIKIDEEDKVYSLRTGLAAGKYYIAITPDVDYSAPLYSVEVISYEGEYLEKEYNNDKDNATPVLFGKEYQGNLFGYDDVDIYSITLDNTSSVTIDFTDTKVSGEKRYSIVLFDSEKEIYSLADCEKRTIVLSLEKGTYYFAVKNSDYESFSNMAYKLSVDIKKQPSQNPPKEDAVTEDVPAENEPVEDEQSEDEPTAKEENDAQEILQFSDVAEGKWYYGELLEAKKLGLINGVGDNLYNPEKSVSVAEIIAMAVRIKNTLGGANTEITNSPVGKWYNSYITFAVNSNLIKRDDFDDFERSATRAEVAYIFANIFDNTQEGKNTVIPDVTENTKYCDEIQKLYGLGILKGDADGSFRPDDSITRAESAAILLRVHKAV